MHQLFQVLLNIASRYTASVYSQRKGGQEASSTMAMDTQLAALGFPYPGRPMHRVVGGFSQVQTDTNNTAAVAPFSASDGGQAAEAGVQGILSGQNTIEELLWTGNEMQLEDFFYNNQASMELLQDTPSEPSFEK